jgi:integrase
MSHRGDNKQRFLVESSLASSTLKKYKKAVMMFVTWCNENDEHAHNNNEMDDLLTDYLHHLYSEGKGRGLAEATYSGVMALMSYPKNGLPQSSRSLKGWQRRHPSRSYPPLTWSLTVLISVCMTRAGRFDYSVGTLLAFDCLLRIGELCGLLKEDVADTGDRRMDKEHRGMALRLRRTKTGREQYVEVEDPSIQLLVRKLVSKAKQGQRLFSFSPEQYRRFFKKVCISVGLSSDYVPHSLRHGGATRKFLLSRSIETVLERGRWASNKSARLYLQSGRAKLLSVEVPTWVSLAAEVLSTDVVLSLSLAQSH